MYRVSSSLVMIKSKVCPDWCVGQLTCCISPNYWCRSWKAKFSLSLTSSIWKLKSPLSCEYYLFYPPEVPKFFHKLETCVWIASWIWWPINYENIHCFCSSFDLPLWKFKGDKFTYTYQRWIIPMPVYYASASTYFIFSRNVSKPISWFF